MDAFLCYKPYKSFNQNFVPNGYDRTYHQVINSTREAGMHSSNASVKICQQNFVSYLNDIRNARPVVVGEGKNSESVGNTGKVNTVIKRNKFKTHETVKYNLSEAKCCHGEKSNKK